MQTTDDKPQQSPFVFQSYVRNMSSHLCIDNGIDHLGLATILAYQLDFHGSPPPPFAPFVGCLLATGFSG